MQIPLSLATPLFNLNSSTHNKVPSSLLESSLSNTSMGTPTTRDRVTKYSNNSNDIFQSEVIFEKIKVMKKKTKQVPQQVTLLKLNYLKGS